MTRRCLLYSTLFALPLWALIAAAVVAIWAVLS